MQFRVLVFLKPSAPLKVTYPPRPALPPQVHFKHVSKVGSTSYGDLLIDVAATGWDAIVIKAECFDLREVCDALISVQLLPLSLTSGQLANFFDALHAHVSPLFSRAFYV